MGAGVTVRRLRMLFIDFTDRTDRLYCGYTQHAEISAMQDGKVLQLGNHPTNHLGLLDNRLNTFLEGQTRYHIVASTIFSYIPEICNQEGVSYSRWSLRDQLLALLLFQAEDRVCFYSHLSCHSSEMQAAELCANSMRMAPTRRIERMHRQTMRTSA